MSFRDYSSPQFARQAFWENVLRCYHAAMYAAVTVFMMGLTLALIAFYPLVRAELLDAHRVTLTIGGAAGELEKSSREWRQASKQSEEITAQSVQVLKNLSTATANLNATTASLTAMIQHTDDSVNVQLLPQIGKTIEENDARLAQLTTDTDKTVVAMAATSKSAADAMVQATATLAQAGKVIGDPAIQAIMANTQTTSKNVAETTAHLNGASADIQEKVHQMTRPASFVKRMAEAVLTLAAPVVSIFK